MILFSFNGFFTARGSASLTSADTGCEATVRANSNRYPAHGSVGVRRPREPHADPPQEGRSRSHLAVEPSSQVQQQQPVGAGSQDCACAGRRRRGTRRAGRTRPGQGLQDGAELLPGRHGWPESRAGAGVASFPPSCVELRGWDGMFPLFLSVEGYGHVVNLSCPIQAAGALSAGPSPRLGPTTLHLQQPSLHTLPLPQMHILFIASLLRQAPACKEHVLVAETGGEWGKDYLK